MEYKLIYTEPVIEDLKEIKEYITEKLYNEDAALRIIKGILDATENLLLFPESGTPITAIKETPSKYQKYRIITVGNYLIFYVIIGKDIVIERVTYGKRDYPAIF